MLCQCKEVYKGADPVSRKGGDTTLKRMVHLHARRNKKGNVSPIGSANGERERERPPPKTNK